MRLNTAREHALTWITTQHQPFTADDAERALAFHASRETVRNAIRTAALPFAYQRRHNPNAASKTTFYRLYFPKHWTRERCAAWLWSNRRSRASVFMPEANNGK